MTSNFWEHDRDKTNVDLSFFCRPQNPCDYNISSNNFQFDCTSSLHQSLSLNNTTQARRALYPANLGNPFMNTNSGDQLIEYALGSLDSAARLSNSPLLGFDLSGPDHRGKKQCCDRNFSYAEMQAALDSESMYPDINISYLVNAGDARHGIDNRLDSLWLGRKCTVQNSPNQPKREMDLIEMIRGSSH
jgi:hypothetical protein